MSGLYIHIPFCRSKCIYCDFYSVGERLALWPDYVDALLAEAAARADELAAEPVSTIYIGGGTPSLLPASEFARLSEGLLKLAGPVEEFTVEVNPDDVTVQLADVWQKCGVNRVSMGVQSFVDSELSVIGRRHDAAAAIHAFELLRSRFHNISLDLMFGLPGQTIDSFRYSVEKALQLRPEHISAYSLMYEERTALTRLRDAGKIEEASEVDSNQMFELLTSMLTDAGYEQYEISNYARPGFRSRHNSSYWRGERYIGLGPAAHSYDGTNLRSANRHDVKAYINYRLAGRGETPRESELLSDDELREEMIMTRLRTREGIDIADFRRRFGDEAMGCLIRRADKWISNGNMILELDGASWPPAGRLALTRSGIMISDEIMADLF